MNAIALFFSLCISLAQCLCFPLRLTRLSTDRIHSVITFQPLFSADISVQLIMPILPSRTGQSVCEWEGGKRGRIREIQPKRMKLHVNCECQPRCLLLAASCILFAALIHLKKSVGDICNSACVFVLFIPALYHDTILDQGNDVQSSNVQPFTLTKRVTTLGLGCTLVYTCFCVFMRVSVFQANPTGVCSFLYPLQVVCCLLFCL